MPEAVGVKTGVKTGVPTGGATGATGGGGVHDLKSVVQNTPLSQSCSNSHGGTP